MTLITRRREGTIRDECSQGRDPLGKMGNMVITSSPVGGVLSVGMLIIIWVALPVVRPFLTAALIVGGIFGFGLWLKHR